MREVWKLRPSGRYSVSNFGRIRSEMACQGTYVGRVLKPYAGNRGYPIAVLAESTGKKKTYTVHKLVAEAFLGPCNGLDVNHKDGDKKNNKVTNLEYTTALENMQHALEHGLVDNRGERHPSCKLSLADVAEIRNLRGLSQRAIGERFGICQAQVWRIIRRKRWNS